jgi:hypothetical protein
MKNKFLKLFIILLVTSFTEGQNLWGSNPEGIVLKRSPEATDLKIPPVNNAFKDREILTFAIKYMGVTAGIATLEVRGIAERSDYQAYHLVSTARSKGVVSLFHKVRDKVESYMDEVGLYTWHFEKHLREGSYKEDLVVKYDQKNCLAEYKGRMMGIPYGVHDPLSSLYYLRTQNFKVGDSVFINTNADGKNWELEVRCLRKERIKTQVGEFDTLVVKPLLKFGGIFQQKGELTVWLTDDERKIPVLMRSKVAIGSIAVILIKIE